MYQYLELLDWIMKNTRTSESCITITYVKVDDLVKEIKRLAN